MAWLTMFEDNKMETCLKKVSNFTQKFTTGVQMSW